MLSRKSRIFAPGATNAENVAKVVLLLHKGRSFKVTESAYKKSRAHYDAIGAIPADTKQILAHEKVKEPVEVEKPTKKKSKDSE